MFWSYVLLLIAAILFCFGVVDVINGNYLIGIFLLVINPITMYWQLEMITRPKT